MLNLYIQHAEDCLFCEERLSRIGVDDACENCERKDKDNCPCITDIGEPVDYYKAVVEALKNLKTK